MDLFKTKGKYDNKQVAFSAIIVALIYLMVASSIFNKVVYVLSLGLFLGAIVIFSLFHKGLGISFKLQMLAIDFYIFVFFLGVFVTPSVQAVVGHYGALAVVCTMVLCLWRLWRDVGGTLVIEAKKNYSIIVLLIVMLLVLIPIINVYPIWDAAWYIGPVSEVANNFDIGWNNNFFDLYLVNHVSASYTLLFVLGKFFCPNSALGIMIMQIILYEITVLAFYGCISKITPKNGQFQKCALTCVFAFSPFMCGMVSDINLDFGIICFFVLFLYCYLNDLRLLSSIMAFVFVFTKEPAIIIFSGFLLGAFLFEVTKAVKKDDNRCLFLITMGTPLLLWMLLYITHGGWGDSSQSSAFSYDIDYAIMKYKQIFVLNFSWLIWILILLLFTMRVINKKNTSQSLEIVIPIISSFIFYLVFNVLFHTVTHARYVSFTCVVISILFAANMQTVNSGRLQKIITLIVACILFIQSFVNIDPLTIKTFPVFEVGNGRIITMFNNVPTDSLIYNREYIAYSKGLEKILRESGYDDDTIVLFSSKNITRYSLEGNRFGLLWNEEKRGFSADNESKRIITVDVEEQIENDSTISGNKAICLVVPFGGNAIGTDEFEDTVNIEKEISIISGKWLFTAYVGEVK